MLAITFRVAGAAYAVRAGSVIAVIPRVALRPIAQVAPWLKGVFVYRGELTPVVDLCQLIAGYACPSRLSARIALVSCTWSGGGRRTLGLLAEQMTEARQVRAELAGGPSVSPAAYFAEVALEHGEPLQFLNVDAIFPGSAALLTEPGAPPRITAGEANRESAKS